jgi:hypothetical protein
MVKRVTAAGVTVAFVGHSFAPAKPARRAAAPMPSMAQRRFDRAGAFGVSVAVVPDTTNRATAM